MYRINEGTFSLPDGWRDRTVNIVASDNSPFQVSLTVTRDDLEWGASFPEYLETQVEKVEKTLSEFELLSRRELVIGGLAAHEIDGHWKLNGSAMHMLTTIFDLGRKALIVTASVTGQMSESQKFEMRKIVESFQPDRIAVS